MSPNYTIYYHTSVAYIPAKIPLFWWPTDLTSIHSDAQAPSLPGWAGLSGIIIVLAIVAASFGSSVLRLRHIPGPQWAAYSRLWLMRVLASGDPAVKLEEVNRKYGRHPGSTSLRRRVQESKLVLSALLCKIYMYGSSLTSSGRSTGSDWSKSPSDR